MKLRNLLDPTTIGTMYAVATVQWHKRPEQERLLAVQKACQAQTTKIGQFFDKKGRSACTEDIPYGRKVITEWVTTHAVALTLENQMRDAQDASVYLNRSLYDVLSVYGYRKPFRALANDFGRFQVRQSAGQRL